MQYFDQMNSHSDGIRLLSIEETEKTPLQLIIQQASYTKLKAETGNVVSRRATYTITFDYYIGVSIIDESHAFPEDDHEMFSGRLCRVYEVSNYLKYMKKVSFTHEGNHSDCKHYRFNCLNHVIDVVAFNEPKVTMSFLPPD